MYNLKRIAVIAIATIAMSTMASHNVNAASECHPLTANSSNITPSSNVAVIQSDDIGWRYKTIKGVLYKRLYNYSKHKWIGDWQKA